MKLYEVQRTVALRVEAGSRVVLSDEQYRTAAKYLTVIDDDVTEQLQALTTRVAELDAENKVLMDKLAGNVSSVENSEISGLNTNGLEIEADFDGEANTEKNRASIIAGSVVNRAPDDTGVVIEGEASEDTGVLVDNETSLSNITDTDADAEVSANANGGSEDETAFTSAAKPLIEMNKAELSALATEKGIKVTAIMSKTELIKLIEKQV